MSKEFDESHGPGQEPEEAHAEAPQPARAPRGARRGGGKKSAANGHADDRDEAVCERQDTSHAPAAETPDLEANAQAATAFLKAIDPDGHHTLVAINPRTGKHPVGTAFAPGSWEEIEAEVVAAGKWNLYWSLNEPCPGTAKPPGKEEIAFIRAVFTDIDVKVAGGAEIVAAGKQEILARLEAFPVPPTAIVDSGNGLQAVWLLDTKLPNIEPTRQRAEALGRRLAQGLGGDLIQNVNRILRLPETVNHPYEDKRKKGRVPVLSRLVEIVPERRYTLAELELRFPPPAPVAPQLPAAETPEPQAVNCPEPSDTEIAAIEEMIDIAQAHGAASYQDLPPDLRARFEDKRRRHPTLDALWRNGRKDKSPGDGSDHVMTLAGMLVQVDDTNAFDATDFASLAWVWPHAIGHSGIEVNAGARSIARAWAKALAWKQWDQDPARAFETIEPGPSEPGKPPDFASLMARLAATRFIDNDD